MLGKETTVEVLGGKYTFGKVSLPLMRELADWIKEQIGDPFTEADKLLAVVERAPVGALQDLLMREWQAALARARGEAEQLRFFDLSCPLARQAVSTIEGGARWCQILLARAHPNITADEAFDVFSALGKDKLEELTAAGMGKTPHPAKNASRPPVSGAGGPVPASTKSAAG